MGNRKWLLQETDLKMTEAARKGMEKSGNEGREGLNPVVIGKAGGGS